MRRAHGAEPLPRGLWAASAARTCLVTNWAGFYLPLQLPASQQRWHAPLFLDSERTTLGDACVIFRPREGETSVLAFSRHLDFAGMILQECER